MKLKFDNLFNRKGENPPKNPKREMLIKQQNKLEELNALFSCELTDKEGDSTVFLYENVNMPLSEELFFDAIKKLAEVVKGNKRIQIIRMATPFVQANPELLLQAGFSIINTSKDMARFLNIFSVARIDRAELLRRFGDNSVRK